jgi:hypothetical protein
METTVNCPYPDSNCRPDAASSGTACAECRRTVKACARCAARNRALANFCRSCGADLPASQGNWLGFKGGARRLGVNGAPPPAGIDAVAFDFSSAGIDLQLGDPCRSLLGCDGQLIAIAQNGAVAIVDPRRPKAIQHFQIAAPTCEPCIDRGVLYAGSRGQLSAWSLGSTTRTTPELRLLWHVALSGTPVQALAVAGNRLYVTVASASAGREVQCVGPLQSKTPAVRTLFAGANVSWLAADAASGRAVFFSEDADGVLLHSVTGDRMLETRPLPLHRLFDHPVALIGGNAYAIFGEQQHLYRIDVETAAVAEALEGDTQNFSIRYGRETEWDQDAVRIDSEGISFSRSGPRDSFNHHDRALRGSPLIVRGRAAVVAMRDRLLVYDLVHPPVHHVWRLKGRGPADSEITAVASFDHYIAAANDQGSVEVVALAGGGER